MDSLNYGRALSSSVIVKESFISIVSNAQKSSRWELLNIDSSVLLNPRELVEIPLKEYVSIVKESLFGAVYSLFSFQIVYIQIWIQTSTTHLII